MQKPIWVKVLVTLASWLVIIAMIVLLYEVLKQHDTINIVPTAHADASTTFNSPGKGDMPIAESIATDTIGFWLAQQSSTQNAYTLPSYLSGEPRKTIVPDLISCESTGIATALNPVDLDGTPSLGLLQFKPLTLWTEAIRFGLIPSSTPKSVFIRTGNPRLETKAQRNLDIRYNAQLQVDVASYMIMENWQSAAFWLQQFPGCFKDYRSAWDI